MRKTLCMSVIFILATLGTAFTQQAVIELNATSFRVDDQFAAVFRLNESIERLFTVYAVFITPNGNMLNAMTLDTPPKPVASNVNGLSAGFTYDKLTGPVPRLKGQGKGESELVFAFFDPSKPITGRQDAFLDVNAKFTIVE
jgi:hypothetical protein